MLQRRFLNPPSAPGGEGKGLPASIRSERRAFKEIRQSADLIIDTSDLTVHSLRRLIVQKFGSSPEGRH